MASRDHYSTLGVPRTASELQIRKAYRVLVLKYHPDRNPGNLEAEETFKRIAEAYGTLSNKDTRARYDLTLQVDDTAILEAQREAIRRKAAARAEAYEKPRPRPRPAAETASRRMRETFADYRMESNEMEARDVIQGILAGALATTGLHWVQMPEASRVPVLVLAGWCAVSLVAGPAGFAAGMALGKLFEGAFDKLAATFSWFEHAGKALPFAGTFLGACGALFASRTFDLDLFTWWIVPGTIAAGSASAVGSAFGRAFTSVTERTLGKGLGVCVAILVGLVLGLMLGLFLSVFATGAPPGIAFFEGFFAAGFGGGIGGALASAAGSLREPTVVEAPLQGFRARRRG